MLCQSRNTLWGVDWSRNVAPKENYNDKSPGPMLPRIDVKIITALQRDYNILLAVRECLERNSTMSQISIRDIAAFYKNDQTQTQISIRAQRSTNQAIAYVMRKLMDKLDKDVAAGLLSGNGCVHWPVAARGTDGVTELTMDDCGREILKTEIDLWLSRMETASFCPTSSKGKAIILAWKPSRTACNYSRQRFT